MHCPPPKPRPYPHPHPNPLMSPPTLLSTPLSSSSLPRTIALHSALTLFVAIPDPHDHPSISIPTCWNSLNSTLPYPSHHLIRPCRLATNTQAFSGLAIAPIHIQPSRTKPSRIESPVQLSSAQARHGIAQLDPGSHHRVIYSPSCSLVVTSGERRHLPIVIRNRTQNWNSHQPALHTTRLYFS